ncbi:rRNA-processing protein [Malassezia sp. CBS 17886]|nr:rRNA-processing protein [Malassezia sp. CBS 17886]
MISSAAWIARGKAARHPTKFEVNDEEVARMGELARRELGVANAQLAEAQAADDDGWEDEADGGDGAGGGSDDDDGDEDDDDEDDDMDDAGAAPDDLTRYRLDEYDAEPSQSIAMGALSNIRGLQAFRDNDKDPYITLKDDAGDDAEEREQLEVLPSDNLIATAKTEDDVSMLEVYVYSATDENLYVHHDLLLPAFPLDLAWLDYTPAPASASRGTVAGTMGNLVAIGTMDPEIEIWNMDTVEAMYPDAILGRKDLTEALDAPAGTGKKRRRTPKARVPNATHHVDAVLSLSWNPRVRNLLASGSADTTVKMWDLSRPCAGTEACALRSFDAHTDKVQSVAWQVSAAGPASGTENPAVLLSGSYDKTIRVFDTRMPEQALCASIPADVEGVRWNGWRENAFVVALETGAVQGFDARNMGAPQYTLVAHDGACTTLDVSPHIPGCLLTGGTDRQVKLWSVDGDGGGDGGGRPRSINLVTARDLDIGKVFTASFSPNDPLTVAVAGSSGRLQVWDTLSNPGMRRTFGDRLRRMDEYAARLGDEVAPVHLDEAEERSGVVHVADDRESDEDDMDE